MAAPTSLNDVASKKYILDSIVVGIYAVYGPRFGSSDVIGPEVKQKQAPTYCIYTYYYRRSGNFHHSLIFIAKHREQKLNYDENFNNE